MWYDIECKDEYWNNDILIFQIQIEGDNNPINIQPSTTSAKFALYFVGHKQSLIMLINPFSKIMIILISNNNTKYMEPMVY